MLRKVGLYHLVLIKERIIYFISRDPVEWTGDFTMERGLW